MPDRARIGVIGTGWWATQHHIPALLSHERASLAAICDPDIARLEKAGDHFAIERRFTDDADLLSSGEVDGVVVAVPHAAHHPVARRALDAGLHALVEKPLTLRASDAWDLVDRARANGLHLMCGYTFQFTRHAARVREIVRSGGIGELRLVTVLFASMVEAYYRGRPDELAEAYGFALTGPRPDSYSTHGGGQGYTQVTHPMGMVLWVTGRRVADVHARMERHGLDVDLVDAITFRLDDGTVGTVASTGTVRPGQDQQQAIWYHGSDGLIVQDLAAGRMEAWLGDGTREELADEDAYPAHLPAQVFADLLCGVGSNPAPGEPAAETVAFLEACYR